MNTLSETYRARFVESGRWVDWTDLIEDCPEGKLENLNPAFIRRMCRDLCEDYRKAGLVPPDIDLVCIAPGGAEHSCERMQDI